jgi:hypothetical protein
MAMHARLISPRSATISTPFAATTVSGRDPGWELPPRWSIALQQWVVTITILSASAAVAAAVERAVTP